MAGWEGSLHRCPACGSGAYWTAPLQPDEGHEARALLICADCGTFLGEEHNWHDLGAEGEAEPASLRRWLRAYRRVLQPHARHASRTHRHDDAIQRAPRGD